MVTKHVVANKTTQLKTASPDVKAAIVTETLESMDGSAGKMTKICTEFI